MGLKTSQKWSKVPQDFTLQPGWRGTCGNRAGAKQCSLGLVMARKLTGKPAMFEWVQLS